MKKRFLALIGAMLALCMIPVGGTTVLAAPAAESVPTVAVSYQNGAFSASNGFTVTASGTITPSTVLENGYGFAEDAYYTVTAPAGTAFTTADGGLSLAFRFRTTTNVQGKDNGGVEKSEQLFHVITPDGRKAYVCMGTLYYQSKAGGVLNANTKSEAVGYQALTTAAKEIVLSIPADASGLFYYVDGVELYSFTNTVGKATAALVLEAMRAEGAELHVHKGASSKSAYMTNTVELSDLEVYGKAFTDTELLLEKAKSITLTEKFSISYKKGVFTPSSDDIAVTVDGEGIAPDVQNGNAFHFTSNTSSVTISATNDTVLSESGTMSLAFLQRVTSVSGSGYLERLLSVVNESGESGDVLLGELEAYRYEDVVSGDGSEATRELKRSTVVKSAYQQLLKSEEYQLVMITVASGEIRVYINGKLAQYYLETGTGSKEADVVPFVTNLFAAELSAKNGSLILRRRRTTSASWNKDVLCLGDIRFFDEALDAAEAYAYFVQNTANATVDALTDGEYKTFACGSGVRTHAEPATRDAFAFRDTASYIEVAANDGKALTKNGEGISFHAKQRLLTASTANAQEALFAVENGAVGAYINLGSLSYYDGTTLTTVDASDPSVLQTQAWKLVSIVVNKAERTIQVYVGGVISQTYTADGADSAVAKVVELFSAEASKPGGRIYVRKSFDPSQNTSSLALEKLIVAEGGLTAGEIASFADRFVTVVNVAIETNIDHAFPTIAGEVGDVIPVPTGIPNGYEFLGYYTDEDYRQPLADGATFTASLKTLWAKLELIRYTVTYHLNGGTQADGNVTSYTSLESVTFYDAEKEGYTFEGWYRTADFRNNVSRLLVGTMGDVELFAKFTPMVYEISYSLNGGMMTADDAPVSYTVEDTVTLVDAWKPYYDFEGWYTEAGSKLTVFDVAMAADVTLYARFTPVSFAIVWETNGGTLTGEAATSYTVEDTVTLVSAQRPHYQFAGWYEDQTLETRFDSFVGQHRDLTLYAKFTPVSYTVGYELDGGALQGTPATSYTVEDTEVKLVDAAKTGYTFEGWYADAQFTTKVERIDPTVGGNLTLYARFTPTKKGCGGEMSGAALPMAGIAAVCIALAACFAAKRKNAR